MIRHIAEHEFQVTVLQSHKLILVDFWAPWCKPCQAMEPILLSLSRRFTMQLDIIKVNIDDEKRIAESCNVKSIPTMIFYRNGKAVKVEFGAKDENYLTGVITDLIKNV